MGERWKCSQRGQQGDEGVDGKVCERVRQPRHAQERPGFCWRRAVRVGHGRGCGCSFVAVGAGGVYVSLQPENQGQQGDENGNGHEKNGFVSEFFHQRAAAEQRQHIRGGPDDVVSTHHARQANGVLTTAHERLDGRPDEAHPDVERPGRQHQAEGGVEPPAAGQRQNHHAEAEFERVEIAAPLSEPSALQ